jgi:plasmid stability protein
MPKKKAHPDPVPPGTMHVRLELSRDQQSKLRVLAAQAGMSMAAYARAIVVREIESAKGGSK